MSRWSESAGCPPWPRLCARGVDACVATLLLRPAAAAKLALSYGVAVHLRPLLHQVATGARAAADLTALEWRALSYALRATLSDELTLSTRAGSSPAAWARCMACADRDGARA